MNKKPALEDLATRFDRHPGKPRAKVFIGSPATSEGSPYPFGYARTALKYGLSALGLGPGDDLMVPDFICASLVEPLVQLGIRPRYYPVDPTLAPDWERMRGLLTTDTKGLIVVHYFGQPQDVENCLDFARQHGLLLIEDNAHGHGAMQAGRLIGTFGNLGISAPRKSFPVENGAYLYLNGDYPIDFSGLRLPRRGPVLKPWTRSGLERLPGMGRWFKGRVLRRERRRRAGMPPAYHSQEAFRDRPMSVDYAMTASTQRYLAQQDLESLRAKRQRLFAVWRSWSDSRELEPVFPELAPGAMPLVYPALAGSAEESHYWFERGHRQGIDIHSWPTLPEAIVARDGPAMRLWERLVCFPIHQAMDEAALQQRIRVL